MQDPKKAATRARHDAMAAAAADIDAWYTAEKAGIAADTTLTDAERRAKRTELLLEVGRRAKRAEDRTRRQNTPGKVLERKALQRLEGRRG